MFSIEKMNRALALIESDAVLADLYSSLRLIASQYNSFHAKPDEVIAKVENAEIEVCKLIANRETELGIKRQSGIPYLP